MQPSGCYKTESSCSECRMFVRKEDEGNREKC